ncbi:hypothetical protein LHV16_17575 [Providencia rettgeri]|uniref:hypothetical protein n=1 Tax=Providencia rettgeri TaxID=587 RepID=UPI001B3843DE|nr:hypothetical protein [Providencia rettgeri]EJD6367777.1 hypothetical protein [Providencia rettgeri]EJD6372004.1 hypothetical protein [Providencia rettgeri]ELR5030537.1 hypothetical protein [Providencia rettgeri]ELR5159529.1 hypothetical protein [Providencia rettgeri]MBQ0361480.1 hypothetical protein [Providencia rettgeri]
MSEDSKNKTYELPESFKRNHQFMPITDHPISLRDQFAMSAMQGDFAAQDAESGYYTNETPDVFLVKRGEFYYRMADAMLKARGK